MSTDGMKTSPCCHKNISTSVWKHHCNKKLNKLPDWHNMTMLACSNLLSKSTTWLEGPQEHKHSNLDQTDHSINYSYKYTHTHAHTHAHSHSHTHSHTHTHTHRATVEASQKEVWSTRADRPGVPCVSTPRCLGWTCTEIIEIPK